MIVLNQQNQYIDLTQFDEVRIETQGSQKRLSAVKYDEISGNATIIIPLFDYQDPDVFKNYQNSYIIGIEANLPMLFLNE